MTTFNSLFASIEESAQKEFVQKFGVDKDTAESELITEDWGDDYGSYKIGNRICRYDDKALAALQKRFDDLGIEKQVPQFPEKNILMPELPSANNFFERGAFDYRPVAKLNQFDLLKDGEFRFLHFRYDPSTEQNRCVIDDKTYQLQFVREDSKVYLLLLGLDVNLETATVANAFLSFQAPNRTAVQALIDFDKVNHEDFVLIIPTKKPVEEFYWLPRSVFYQYYRACEHKVLVKKTINTLSNLESSIVYAEHAAASKAQHEQLKSLNITYNSAIKPVIGGLTERSWGNGAVSNTVSHFVFNEPHGKYEKGDFLCGNPQGRLRADIYYDSYDLNVEGLVIASIPYVITCKTCLKKLEAMLKKVG